jgi:Fe-S-cluster containining protein
VEALVELLVERGVLDRAEVDERREAAEERLRGDFVEKGMAVAIQEHPTSKYEVENAVQIDCESRVHLCKAACCRLSFALSKEDVEESVVRWDLGRPYMIAQTTERRCIHLHGGTHTCGVYDQRPVPCRTYDCRADRRVWLDFDERIANPRLDDPNWPQGALEDDDPS